MLNAFFQSQIFDPQRKINDKDIFDKINILWKSKKKDHWHFEKHIQIIKKGNRNKIFIYTESNVPILDKFPTNINKQTITLLDIFENMWQAKYKRVSKLKMTGFSMLCA